MDGAGLVGACAMSERETTRNEPVEIAGLIVCSLLGALLGLSVPFKGVQIVATAVMFAIIGALVWARRKEPAGTTIGVCGATLLIGWPIALIILGCLHQYYNQYTF